MANGISDEAKELQEKLEIISNQAIEEEREFISEFLNKLNDYKPYPLDIARYLYSSAVLDNIDEDAIDIFNYLLEKSADAGWFRTAQTVVEDDLFSSDIFRSYYEACEKFGLNAEEFAEIIDGSDSLKDIEGKLHLLSSEGNSYGNKQKYVDVLMEQKDEIINHLKEMLKQSQDSLEKAQEKNIQLNEIIQENEKKITVQQNENFNIRKDFLSYKTQYEIKKDDTKRDLLEAQMKIKVCEAQIDKTKREKESIEERLLDLDENHRIIHKKLEESSEANIELKEENAGLKEENEEYDIENNQLKEENEKIKADFNNLEENTAKLNEEISELNDRVLELEDQIKEKNNEIELLKQNAAYLRQETRQDVPRQNQQSEENFPGNWSAEYKSMSEESNNDDYFGNVERIPVKDGESQIRKDAGIFARIFSKIEKNRFLKKTEMDKRKAIEIRIMQLNSGPKILNLVKKNMSEIENLDYFDLYKYLNQNPTEEELVRYFEEGAA